jgi:pyridoxine kinase
MRQDTMASVPTILSIQSSVAYGHVGNSAATFPLMRMGVEVWPVLTVHFSNNTGYGAWRGPVLAAADVADVVRGMDERDVLGGCDAVLSGYQGAADIGSVVLDTVALVKQRNPDAVYCCDPVMGDVDRGFFVTAGIPELIRDRVVPAADIITPNQFELEYLTSSSTSTMADVLGAAQVVRQRGPEIVLVTSVLHADTAPGTIEMVAVSSAGAWSVTTPLLPRASFNGAGDLTAAIFLARWLAGGGLGADLGVVLAATAARVHGVLAVTVASGERELQLVAAQDELVAPTASFTAVRLA